MKYLYTFCLVAGLVFTYLIAGGCDCGSITFGQFVWYSIGGLLLAFVGWAGLRDLKEKAE